MLLWLLAFAIVCAITVLAADNFDAHKDVTLYAATTAVGRIPVSLLLFLAVNMTAGTKKMSERHNLSGLESLRGVTSEYSVSSFLAHLLNFSLLLQSILLQVN